MTNWDAHDTRTSQWSAWDEANLIRQLAKERSTAARKHKRGCTCPACRVRRIDANMRALRKITADAKRVAA